MKQIQGMDNNLQAEKTLAFSQDNTEYKKLICRCYEG